MTREEQIAKIERDRKTREDGLLLWLLLLGRRARLNVARAIRVGASWGSVLRGVFLGDETIDQPGGTGVLARGMADSHLAGYHRAGLLAGVSLTPPTTLAELTTIYVPAAERQLNVIATSLGVSVAAEIDAVVEADRITADVAAVAEAFKKSGWTPDNPYGAQIGATKAVTQAYGSGMSGGYVAGAAAGALVGLRYTAIRDERTTSICRKYDGTQLPPESDWWLYHWPPCHWNCRSVVLPIRKPFVPTVHPPLVPMPDEGFGYRI